ncbi:MAG: hypothetical protein IM662_09030 [Phenylobacterium sp.]|uniref:hypothetical protein n=1 Tax=Phenylobacterium sp. TaxID=1871053 RepID=UPI0025F73B6D|nr:hypothetical protein [Phenylobacterium sp.]MCA3730744.1 hypothetical protein [Phenylobacterium sp.]MCA6244272.1 hypothetical protein [Phenylobacterium sp.]MCA6277887.1 hypothetical protein [Phenylobacterium sp.]MCA6293923.1 hypothetical protein [Phenylobacterium sp.]
MNPLIILVVSSVLMAAFPAKAVSDWSKFYRIYRITAKGGGIGIFVDSVIVVTRPEDGRWVAERWREDDVLGKTKRTHDWIDSRACPQLAAVLDSLATLPKNGILPPDRADSQSLALDVTTVSVTGPASVDGETRITLSDRLGPVAAWWRRSSEMLQPCWQADPPKVDGAPLPSRPGLKDLP